MDKKTLTIDYTEYDSVDELEPKYKELMQAATEALKGSYAPYSNFNVGAAVRLRNGIVVKGANQENAAFPSGLCAERVAMFSAAARYPQESFDAIALIAAQNGDLQPAPSYPCGACRQVMAQYQTKAGKPMSVIMVGAHKVWKFACVDDILPLIFDSI